MTKKIKCSTQAYEDWKTQTQSLFLRGKNKNARWRSGLLDHFPQCLDWKRTRSAKVRSPQWSRGTYSGGGGPLGSPNIPTRKHKCLYEQLITYISTQKAVNVDHPYTDGSNALRVVTSTLTGPLLLPAPKPAEKPLQKRLNSVCRLPKSPCLFFSHPTQFIHLPLIPWFFGKTTTISGKGFWQIFRAQYTHLGIFIRANTTSAAKRCVCVLCRKRREDAGWPGWNPPYPGCISSSIIFISPAFLGMTPRATM